MFDIMYDSVYDLLSKVSRISVFAEKCSQTFMMGVGWRVSSLRLFGFNAYSAGNGTPIATHASAKKVVTCSR
jgi:hypothetical protein